jgi:hypothetical protein
MEPNSSMPFGHNLIRCALALVLLAASGIASATLTYDYSNKILFDSSTNLYWSSGPKDLGGWQVATGQQVTTLFSEVGFSFQQPFSSPATFSNVVADLVLFFSTGSPSPRPILGSLPLGDLGNLPPGFFPCHSGIPAGPFLRGGNLRGRPMAHGYSQPQRRLR